MTFQPSILIVVAIALVVIVLAWRCLFIALVFLTATQAERVTFEFVPWSSLPAKCAPVVDQLKSAGFVAVGVVSVRPGRLPAMTCCLLADEARRIYARVSAFTEGATPGISLGSPLANGTVATSNITTGGSVNPREMLQGFPGASFEDLLGHHIEAQALLHGEGIAIQPTPAGDVVAFNEREWKAEGQAARELGPWRLLVWAARAGDRRQDRDVPLAQRADYPGRLAMVRAASESGR